MPDEHCRITVVGERRQVDLAVPAAAPITTYVGALARLCAQSDSDILPSAWSLSTAVDRPFAPERSLAELGVVDGQILYLCNTIADEFADPVVYDVGERVADVAQSSLERRWDAQARTLALMTAGLVWSAATLIVLAARHQATAALIGDVAATAGLVLPAVAWLAAKSRRPVPRRPREVLALSAVPFLALAARMEASHEISRMNGAHGAVTPGGLTAAVLLGGALAGAILAYLAAPGVASCAVLLAGVLAAAIGSLLVAVRATEVEVAAVVAVVAFWLLTIAPATVGRLVAFGRRRAAARSMDEPDGDAVAGAVRAATALLVLWSCGLAAVVATALVPMAASRSPYAAAAAGCLGLALLLRAGTVRLVAEAVPVAAAGAVGLFTLLVVGPGHLGWPGGPVPVDAALLSFLLPLCGLRRLMRRPRPAPAGGTRWSAGLAAVLGGAGVALTVATFDVVGWFVSLGRHL